MMKRNRVRLNETFIIELLVIWFVFQSAITSSLLRYSSFQRINTIIQLANNAARILMIAFGFFSLLKDKIRKDFLVPLILYVLTVFVTKVYNGAFQFLDALFVAFVFKNKLKRKRLIDIFFWTALCSFVLVILMYYAGFFPHFAVFRLDGRERLYLGFSHPNTVGYYVMILCFLSVLRIRERIRYLHIVALIAAAYFVYVYPNSFSSALSILLLALYLIIDKLYYFFFRRNAIRSRFLRYGSIAAIPLIIVVVFWFVANASSSMLANEMLRTFYSRFRLGGQAIQRYGIHLFGSRNIEFVGTAARYFESSAREYFTVDCFYIQILVRFGIVPSLLFFMYYIACIKACISARDPVILVMLIIIAIYSINESMVLAVPTSFLFIIASGYLWNNQRPALRASGKEQTVGGSLD